jgi:menaquinone-dependent protoporphyrinogen IX oxidase
MWTWNFDDLTLEDVALLASGDVSSLQLFDMMGRCVVGGKRAIPALKVSEAVQEFVKAYAEAVNPKGTAALSTSE